MTIKKITILIGILSFLGVTPISFADGHDDAGGHMERHKMMPHGSDQRISLGLSPKMRLHQLANMRSHVEAVQTIIGLIGEGDFNTASEIAHSQLGLTEEMEKMCNNFNNEQFTNLGLEFHKSADTLGETLKTKDISTSLRALHTTMGYCVQCHATFRQ